MQQMSCCRFLLCFSAFMKDWGVGKFISHSGNCSIVRMFLGGSPCLSPQTNWQPTKSMEKQANGKINERCYSCTNDYRCHFYKNLCNYNIIWKQRWICAGRLCNTPITWHFLCVFLDLRVFDLLAQTESADIFFIDFKENICGTYFEHVKSVLRANSYK